MSAATAAIRAVTSGATATRTRRERLDSAEYRRRKAAAQVAHPYDNTSPIWGLTTETVASDAVRGLYQVCEQLDDLGIGGQTYELVEEIRVTLQHLANREAQRRAIYNP